MNDQNLRPRTTLSKEEAKRLGSKGGIISGKVRRENAIISETYAKALIKKSKVSIDGKPATGKQLLEYAIIQILTKGSDSSKIMLMREMREAIEGNKVQVSGAFLGVDIPYENLTEKQRTAICAANEALAEGEE